MATNTDKTSLPAGGQLRHNMANVLVPVLAAVLLSPFLPRIHLDTAFADVVVRLTDTATWALLTPVSVAAVLMLISRSGISI